MSVDLGAGRGWLTAPAAASIRRLDRQLGHPLQITEAGRTWLQQKAHWDTYQRNGRPIALHPDTPSIHQIGKAIDTDEGQRILAVMRDHGWVQTVYRNGKLVEPWHFEYSVFRDNHRNDPEPTPPTLEDLVTAPVKLYLYTPNNNLLLVDHLNKTIRELGNDPKSFERGQFDTLPNTRIAEPKWTQTFASFAYVTKPNLAPGVTE